VLCGTCGKQTGDTDRFCAHCGSQVAAPQTLAALIATVPTLDPEESTMAAASATLCNNCGREISPSDEFCQKCGKATPLYEQRSPLRDTVPVPASVPSGDQINPPPRQPQTPDGVLFDKQEQLLKIEAALLPDESLEAVFDMKGGGTGFIGITSKRIIVYDKAFLRKMKAVVTVPYSRINTVAAQDDSGLLTGRGFFSSSTLIVTTSHGELQFEFRGADKAHTAHNMILNHIL
jgi:hypothetical protein